MEHKHHTEEEHREDAVVSEAPVEEIEQSIKNDEKKEWMLPASIVFAAIVIAAAFIYASGAKSIAPTQKEKEVVTKAPEIAAQDVVLGNVDAPVTIIEYGDFQCPYCALFYKQFEPTIKKELIDTGKANYVFKSFPFLGAESDAATIAAECAKDQGKFWEMHNAIYDAEYKELEQVMAKKLQSSENNGNLDVKFFNRVAQANGMDTVKFSTCLVSGPYAGSPEEFRNGAKEVGVRGTPSLFVNGEAVELETPEKLVQYVNSLVK